MLATIGFSILGLIFVVSLIVSGFAYKRQQSINEKKRQIRHLQQSKVDYQDTLNALLQVDKSTELACLLQKQVINLCERVITVDPTLEESRNNLEKEQAFLKQIKEGSANSNATPAKNSDEEIGVANLQLNQVTKLLSSSYKKGKLPKGKYVEFINHINRLRLDIDVESHTNQGERYADKSDWIMSQSHFKLAKEALRTTKIEFPERNEKIRHLSERIKELQKRSFITEAPNPKVEP